MEQFYYAVAATAYAVFIIRFILSWVGGDFDLDTDLDISDVVSFKGLTHFLMGSFGWLSLKSYITHSVQWYDFIIAFIIGLIFVIILFYIYKLMLKLESSPVILEGKDLVGQSGKIYLSVGKNEYGLNKYLITVYNGNGTTEVDAVSPKIYNIGDVVTLKLFEDSCYIIY